MRRFLVWSAIWIAVGSSAPITRSEDQPPQRVVAAQIGGEPVYLDEAQHEFNRAYDNQQIDDGQRPALLKRALDQVIDRRLVLGYLERSGQAASEQDVDFSLAQLEKDLQSQDLTLKQHLAQVKLTDEDLRRSLSWKLSWNKYLAKYLTEENLQKYFDRHRREFDGTQLRVAHILLKVAADASESQLAEARQKAAALRDEVAAGKLSFAAAAEKHSQAPTAKAGGNIGWIERHQPMPEAFSQAAFVLEKGQISQPVTSPAGVHLITVLEIKPGTKTRQEVESQLRPAVTLYLFRWIAEKERAKVKIEYKWNEAD
jgi:parvulin-like peptidyl-prolyl isomerase